MKTSPVAWLCMNKKSGSLFALTQEQLNELGYGNISMPEFEKVAPLYCYEPAKKLWLWKNFVDGKPEYWAFDNPYPTNLDDGDPQTLGQPCGYAIFKPSRDGSCGRTEEQVLREMKSVTDYEAEFIKDWNEGKVRRVSDGKRMVPEPEPVAWMHPTACDCVSTQPHSYKDAVPLYTAPPQREFIGLTDEEMMIAAFQAGFDVHEDYDNEDDPDALHWWSEDGERCDDTLHKLRDIISAKLREKNGNL